VSAVIKTCSCKSAYQDALYGKGNRVMNAMLKPPGHRCTVCGKEYAT
jgi:hypothetical protein